MRNQTDLDVDNRVTQVIRDMSMFDVYDDWYVPEEDHRVSQCQPYPLRLRINVLSQLDAGLDATDNLLVVYGHCERSVRYGDDEHYLHSHVYNLFVCQVLSTFTKYLR